MTDTSNMKFGLLMPHFGGHASRRAVLDGAVLAESFGFDSLWVRDHLVFEPHSEMEAADITFYEALTTLTAIGAVTENITLGTGSLIPFRHPVHTAISVGTLCALVGDRVVLGFGAGTFDHEFDVVDMAGIDRVALVRSNAAILRRLLTEDGVTYRDDVYSFDNISIEPKPGAPVPFWYCGATPRSARLAAEYCDGWMPGRTTLLTIEERVATMRELTAASGRPMPRIAVIPPTSIAPTHDLAVSGVNLDGLSGLGQQAGQVVGQAPVGPFRHGRGHRGLAHRRHPRRGGRAGPPLRRRGGGGSWYSILRMNFDRWFASIELLGREVLPALRS